MSKFKAFFAKTATFYIIPRGIKAGGMFKFRTDNKRLFPAIIFFLFVAFTDQATYAFDTASAAPSSPTGMAVALDLEDFLCGATDDTGFSADFIEILGPLENGRLFLQSVPNNENSAMPVCLPPDELTAPNNGDDKTSVMIQWTTDPDGINEDVTEICSSVYIPVELFSESGNVLFLPDRSFTGLINLGFRLGTQTAGEKTAYSNQGTIILDIVPGTARSIKKAVRSSGPYPKDYIIRAKEGAIVQVGKRLKSLAGKTAAKIRIVELPDSDVGVLRIDSLDVQRGQEITTSKLTALYFSPSNNADFFGDLAIKWLAITAAGVESDTAVLTIRYSNVVDPPTTGDSALTIAKDTSVTFTADDFVYSSKDNGTFNKLKIRSLPGSATGKLEYNGVRIKSAGKIIDLSSGKPFVFKPVEGKLGTASFRFNVGSGKTFSKQSGNFVITIIESVALTEAPVLFTSILSTTNPLPVWTWATLDKATGYEVSFDGTTWTDVGSKLSYKPESELSPGAYSFSVRGKNSTGVGPEVTNIFTVLPPFSSDTPVFDETGTATLDTTPTWTWSSLSGAIGYEVSFDGTTWTDRGSNQTYTPSDSSPLSVGSYTIYLRAYNSSAIKSLVATSSLKIVSDLSAATPILTATVSSTSTIPSWSWNEVPGATSYETSFDNIAWTDRGAGLSFTPDTQLATGSHTFYLRARNEVSTSTHGEDAFVIFKTLPVNPAVTISDISVTESGNLSLDYRQHGSIDLSNLFLDPDGYTVNLAEPVIACEDETAIVASISTSKSFDWVSDGIGKCTVTIQGTSGPEGNLKTGSTSFNVEIKPINITMGNISDQTCLAETVITPYTLFIPLSGIATSLLSDSQIFRMIKVTVLTTSGGATDSSSLVSNGTWTIPTTPAICTDTNCTRLDKIRIQYKVIEDTKRDHLQIDFTFGGVTTTKNFDIYGNQDAACL